MIIVVFYYYVGKKQHLLASLRKTERNIFVPSGLVTGVFEELPIFPQAYEQQQQAPSSSDGACILAGYGPKQPHKYSLISQRSSPANGEY